nr:MAG: hypothetical protein [Bacteriophage sp.]
MNLRRARQITKQNHLSATLVQKILEAGPTDDRSLFEVMRKRGWKGAQGALRELITALTVTGKVATRKGVHRLATDDEPVPQRPVRNTLAVNNIANENERTEKPKEKEMDLTTLTPDQMMEMAAQMQKMAEAKKRELDPELLRQLLESGQSVLDAADLLAETTERFRRAMDAVREARGLPTTKKV